MRRCDAIEVIHVGLALPVRRQRGTGHRGGAVLVPAAPQAEIDTHAPSARCAAAHCGVLLTTAERAVGSPYPPYASSIALPLAMPLVPLFSHLGAERGPLLLNAGRATAGLARPRRTPARWAGVAGRSPTARRGRAHRRCQGDVVAPRRPGRCLRRCLRCLPHGHAVLLSCRVSSLRMPVPWSRSRRARRRRTRRARRAPRAGRCSRSFATRLLPCRATSAPTRSC